MKIPKVTLDQWRTLQAVVDCGGYAQAAEKLHRSQSSISYAVAKLQEQLGIDVLRIEGRKAFLTDEGKAILQRSRHVIESAAGVEQLAASLRRGWEAELRLVVDGAFPSDCLIEVLKAFEPISKGCRIQLREVMLSGAAEAVESGDAELIIGAWVPRGHLGEQITHIEFVAVASPEHPLHHLNRSLLPADLQAHRQVVISDSGQKQNIDKGWLEADQRWTVTHLSTAISTITHGLGYGWIPRQLITKELASGKLIPLPLREGGAEKVPLYMIFGHPDNVGPATIELADLFRQITTANSEV